MTLARGFRGLSACSVLAFIVGCKSVPAEPRLAADPVQSERALAESPADRRPSRAAEKASDGRCIDPMRPVDIGEAAGQRAPKPVIDARCPSEPGLPRRFKQRAIRVGAETVTVELATTEAEREQGLMYRRDLPDGAGMLFDMAQEARYAFWMHNTCIPLDIGFLAPDGTLVGVVESAAPLTDDARGVRCPSRYVLELPSGWYRRHGVLPGAHIDLRN